MASKRRAILSFTAKVRKEGGRCLSSLSLSLLQVFCRKKQTKSLSLSLSACGSGDLKVFGALLFVGYGNLLHFCSFLLFSVFGIWGILYLILFFFFFAFEFWKGKEMWVLFFK